jgi:hypothetical protein
MRLIGPGRLVFSFPQHWDRLTAVAESFGVLVIGVVTMSEEKKAEKTQTQILRDAFEGMKGRQPKSDQELKEWLGTDEGKEATMFGSTSFSRFGETGRA